MSTLHQPSGIGSRFDTLWVPRWLLDRTWSLLRQDGLKGVESTVLWGGRRFGNDAVAMAVLCPTGGDVSFSRGLVRVGPDTTAEMGRWLRAEGLRGLAQVHTHPGSWIDHSRTDDDSPIVSSDGFVSLVWPNYASLPVREITELGVHRLVDGQWHRYRGDRATQLVRVIESEASIWVSHGDDLGDEDDRLFDAVSGTP
jgi:hypothetical protein